MLLTSEWQYHKLGFGFLVPEIVTAADDSWGHEPAHRQIRGETLPQPWLFCLDLVLSTNIPDPSAHLIQLYDCWQDKRDERVGINLEITHNLRRTTRL